jgi:hypothetical protein
VRRGRDDDTGSVSGIASRSSRLTHQRADVDRCSESDVEERGRASGTGRSRMGGVVVFERGRAAASGGWLMRQQREAGMGR